MEQNILRRAALALGALTDAASSFTECRSKGCSLQASVQALQCGALIVKRLATARDVPWRVPRQPRPCWAHGRPGPVEKGRSRGPRPDSPPQPTLHSFGLCAIAGSERSEHVLIVSA